MPTQPPLNFEGIERQPLRAFTEKAYLDYSMYVILDRALPHIGDGLKPVQRRIVYAMSELGLSAASKHKKSARTIGDVIGKFHPHGDSACYEAMVLMAQPFSYRYPLVDGQGNFGSPDDPKSFAAMRYTESRLTRYAVTAAVGARAGHGRVVAELRRHARRAGAAAGARAERAAERRDRHRGRHGDGHSAAQSARSRDRLRAAARGAGEPRSASCASTSRVRISRPAREIISPRAEIRQIYKTGNGSIRARAVYEIEDGDIVITQLPVPGVGQQDPGADRRADAGEEAADGRGHPRRVGSRASDAHRDRAALEPRRHRAADGAPVRDHGPRAHLSRQSQHHRPRRPAEGDGPEVAARGVAEVPHRHRHAAPQLATREGAGAAAHPRRPARGLSESRRGDQDHPPRGRAEAGADEALQADRDPGRGDPRDQAAPPGEARGDEDPRRAEGAQGRGAQELEKIAAAARRG